MVSEPPRLPGKLNGITLKSVKWMHQDHTYGLLSCPGSLCVCTVVLLRPDEDPSVQGSGESLLSALFDLLIDAHSKRPYWANMR